MLVEIYMVHPKGYVHSEKEENISTEEDNMLL